MEHKKTALVIGSGAGGAAMARELQGDYDVTILEAGGEFKPFGYPLKPLAELRRTGLFLDERLIRLLLPAMDIIKTEDMVLVRGIGVGGTTTLATGNAVRYDGDLKALGLDLDPEFAELAEELPVTTAHRERWTETTRRMYDIFEEQGLEPVVTPKLLCAEKCVQCGRCALGCPTGAKWDTRAWVQEATAAGARLETGTRVTRLRVEAGRVVGVEARRGGKKVEYTADVVVLAAGGLGTPAILRASGIPCEQRLFVDPVLCVAGPLPGIGQEHQILMPFISQQEGYILSPYMDYLSFFFDRRWRKPLDGLASIMIKLADEEQGGVSGRGVQKTLTDRDNARLKKAVRQCREILTALGVPAEQHFLGIVNAGHPGGMLPLTEAEAETLHPAPLPQNLYVADATLLPKSMGNPPILTIMALSKRIARILKEKAGE